MARRKNRSSGRPRRIDSVPRRRPAAGLRGNRPLGFEPLEGRLLLAADFGDAPSPYATHLADNGPRHEAVGPMLGVLRDTEADGVASGNADGDGAGDDGVVFGPLQAGQLGATVEVTVSNAPAGARLDAWIDFDGDGHWGGAGERIATSIVVSAGVQAIEFDVPATIAVGAKFARFRVSEAGGLGPNGAAPDGEVEDYRVNILSPAAAADAFNFTIVIDEGDSDDEPALDRVRTVDLDRDGDLDIVAAGRFDTYDDAVLWYENDGAGAFTRHAVDELSGYDFRDVIPADLDNDGDLDLVTPMIPTFRWYENDGQQNFTQRALDPSVYKVYTAAVADVDADGDLDVLATIENFSHSPPVFPAVWYENAGAGQFIKRIVATGAFADGIQPIDVDRDGDLDLMSFNSSGVAIHENNGSQTFTLTTVFSTDGQLKAVTAADIDGDQDADLLLAGFISGTGPTTGYVKWLENRGPLGFEEHDLTSPFTTPNGVEIADVDGDGDMDGMVASGAMLAIYENDGQQNFAIRQMASSGGPGGEFTIADFNGDGDLDIVRLNILEDWITVHEQIDNRVSVAAVAASVVESGGQPVEFIFARTGHLAAGLTVYFSVAGPAIFETDYTQSGAAMFSGTEGAVFFAPGQVTASLLLTPVDDDLREVDETIVLTILDVPEYEQAAAPVAEAAILDDDQADFGDAPGPYPTTLADDGPRHVATGPRLGAGRDQESNAAPNAAADGDDASGAPDDEDGVTYTSYNVGALGATATIDVQNAPEGAKLDAWIDFDGDGSWGAAGERIAAGLVVAEGANVVTFDVPAWANPGTTYARFRLSTAGVDATFGVAPDGEVEDYAVTITPPGGAGFFSTGLSVDGNTGSARSVALADLDRDGDMDAVSTTGGVVMWHENNGAGGFTRRAGYAFDLFGAFAEVAVADLDADGDLDLVATGSTATFGPADIVWLENDGSQNFTAHVIADLNNAVHRPVVADLDDDGDLDFALASRALGGLWYENDSAGGFTGHTFTTGVDHVDVADVDRDGDVDLVTAVDNIVRWHENTGGAFTAHDIPATAFGGAATVRAADIDRDGDVDLLATGSGPEHVVWFENDGAETFVQRTIAAGERRFAGAADLADFDGDGDWDVAAAYDYPNEVAWYKNNGDQTFERHSISANSAVSLATGDMDGDGDLDVVVASSGSSRVLWYKNVPHAFSVAASAPSAVEDAGSPITFTFTRHGDASAPAVASFYLPFQESAAAFNVDYTQTGALSFNGSNGSVAFDPGQTTATVLITPVADATLEQHEMLSIALVPGASYGVTSPRQATITVFDDEPVDYGDLPAPFTSLREAGGPGHMAVGPQLGPTRDADAEGTPSDDAAGDGADDDGVIFSLLRPGRLRASATVNVQNAPAGAKLDAWIDFDGDGNFRAAGEKVAHWLSVQNGDNTIYFDVPAGARVGATFARFRLSTAGGLMAGGLTPDGEVEDYQIQISPPAPSGHAFVFGQQIGAAYRAEPVDYDQDGKMDVIVVRSSTNGAMTAHLQTAAGYVQQSLPSAGSQLAALVPADFDFDGDIDFILARDSSSAGLQWLENLGGSFGLRSISIGTINSFRSATAVDFDGDGDLDVVAGSTANDVAWYERTGATTFQLQYLVNVAGVIWTDAVDFDRDGDIDIVSGSDSGLRWHEHRGGNNFSHIAINSDWAGVKRFVQAADVDSDGDLDFIAHLPTPGALAWYERNDNGFYVEHLFNAVTGFPAAIDVADMDGDGDVDVITADNQGIRLFTNTGGVFSSRNIVDTSARTSVRAADMDQDGDLDILSVSSGGVATWWENLAASDGDADDDGDVDGTDLLAWQRTLGGAAAPGAGADGNGDGAVNAADLAAWRATFGAQTGPMAGGLALATSQFNTPLSSAPSRDASAASIDAYLASDLFAAPDGPRASRPAIERPQAVGHSATPVGWPLAPVFSHDASSSHSLSAVTPARCRAEFSAEWLDEAFDDFASLKMLDDLDHTIGRESR